MSSPVDNGFMQASVVDDDALSDASTFASEKVTFEGADPLRPGSRVPPARRLAPPVIPEESLQSVAVDGREMERAWIDAQITPPIGFKAAPDVNALSAPVPGFKGPPPVPVPSPVRVKPPPPVRVKPPPPVRVKPPPPPVPLKPPPVVRPPPPVRVKPPPPPPVPLKPPPIVRRWGPTLPPATSPPVQQAASAVPPAYTAPSVEVQQKKAADEAAEFQRQANVKKDEVARLQVAIDAAAAKEKREILAATFADETDRREAELESQIASITTYIEELVMAEAEGRASMPLPPAPMVAMDPWVEPGKPTPVGNPWIHGLSQAEKDASPWAPFNAWVENGRQPGGVDQDRL